MKIAVMSGKGGVGKSSVSALVAVVLAESRRTLLLDFDLCGPSVRRGLGAEGEVYKAEKGLVPVRVSEQLHALSMASMIKDTDSVIWRGPKKLSTLSMFLDSADGFECVVIDTPPGLSEEHRFLVGKGVCVLIVTTPQNVSLSDASKAINFCRENAIPVLGLVENMSGYRCECGCISNVFGANGGELLAREFEIPFLCRLEIEPMLGELLDSGRFVRECRSLDGYSRVKRVLESLDI